jgi:hypothetical protein
MADYVVTSKKEKMGVDNPIIKDENGYYKVTFGAINTFNKNGIYYKVTDIDRFFGPNSIIGRRINEGVLIAEYQHPKVDGMSVDEIRRRTFFLDGDRKAAHIKKIELYNTGKTEPGFDLPVYKVYGWVRPSGPYGKYLQDALDNPDENVAFSIRSLVKTYRAGNIWVKEVKLLSTYDYVPENGMPGATQWNAAGLESFMPEIDNVDELYELMKGFENTAMQCKDGKCVIGGIKHVLKKDKGSILYWE